MDAAHDGRKANDVDLGLTDKVALVTGSYRGTGVGIARSLAAEGATVMFAVYGHPCVLHTGVQLTLRAAANRKIPTRILPGISSIDGVLFMAFLMASFTAS